MYGFSKINFVACSLLTVFFFFKYSSTGLIHFETYQTTEVECGLSQHGVLTVHI